LAESLADLHLPGLAELSFTPALHDGKAEKSMLYPTETSTRAIQNLNGIWELAFDPTRSGHTNDYSRIRPEGRIPIAVPGSINEQVTDRAINQSMEWFWYYRSFRVSPLWRGQRILLRIGSATFQAEVFVNGQRIGSHTGGYLPFTFDLTEVVHFDRENELVVRVDNDLSPSTIPQGHVDPAVGGVAAWRPGIVPDVHYDFFPFSGIHRPVQLVAVPESRIESIRLTTEELSGSSARLRIEVETLGAAHQVRVSIPELGFEQVLDLSQENRFDERVRVDGVTPWAPLAAKLYDIDFSVLDTNGAVLDQYIQSFGFRTVEVSGGEVLVNGQPVYLRGFGRHEDITVIGKGESLPHIVKDFNLMKWMGANSYRTSHYPYSEEDLRMADRQGLMVIDEAAANTISFRALEGKPKETAEIYAAHVDHLNELFERDYNHPCVIAWSLGNECETWEPNSVPYFTDLVAHARTLDQSRPITSVVNAKPGECLCSHLFDLICVNRYPAWYGEFGDIGAIKGILKKNFDDYWERFKKPILLSEFGADAITGLHTDMNLMWSEEYQVSYLREALEAAEAHPRVVGAHIWNFADFKVGQHTSRIIYNWKGVLTRDRHPKMAAHMIREWWTNHKPAALD